LFSKPFQSQQRLTILVGDFTLWPSRPLIEVGFDFELLNPLPNGKDLTTHN
jgi:hypothetical protein